MSSNPIKFRLPLNIEGKADPQVVEAMQWHDDAINDLQQAIPSLKAQIDAKTTTTTGTTTTQAVASASQTVVIPAAPSTIGTVNNQTGNVAYVTGQGDYGALIIVDDASPVAVTLSTAAITTPFFVTAINYGAGLATLTPATGTISYPGSLAAGALALAQGVGAAIYYDGSLFWAILFPAPLIGFSGTITTAKLTVGGTNGSMTFVNGILTAQVAAT